MAPPPTASKPHRPRQQAQDAADHAAGDHALGAAPLGVLHLELALGVLDDHRRVDDADQTFLLALLESRP
jgi:hypothetical protein